MVKIFICLLLVSTLFAGCGLNRDEKAIDNNLIDNNLDDYSTKEISDDYQNYYDFYVKRQEDESNKTEYGKQHVHNLENDWRTNTHPRYNPSDVLVLDDMHIEDFSFLQEYSHIRSLVISRCAVESFDYFVENLPNLSTLEIFAVSFGESVESIPYISTLSNLLVRDRGALGLISNNTHIDRYLEIGLEYTHYNDAENVHVSLEAIGDFDSMRLFAYRGYTTTLDVYFLKNCVSLVYIDIWRDVEAIDNLDKLALLPNLEVLLVPTQFMRGIVEGDIFRDDIDVGMGS